MISKAYILVKKHLFIFLQGLVMGFAEIIPGVSGGTMALILGIYERLILSISKINFSFFKKLIRGQFREAWLYSDCCFLLVLIMGMIVAVAFLSTFIIFLLEDFPFFLKALFSGILFSSLFYKPLKPESINLKFLTGSIFSILFIGFSFSFAPIVIDLINPLYLFFGGFVAACAFILPGISGSFILLLLGLYPAVLLSIKEFDLLLLSILLFGCMSGLLLFIRILKKAYDAFRETLSGFFYFLILLSIPLIWKTGIWSISFPNSNQGYIEVSFGLMIGIILIFFLQKITANVPET